MRRVIWAYVLAIVVAEVVTVYLNAAIGVAAHALIVITLIANYIWREAAPYRRMLPVLALVPLLRILGLALPSPSVPLVYWYAVVGIPILVAATLAAHLLRFSPTDLGLKGRNGLTQVVIAISGLPLGAAAYLILRPIDLIVGFDWLAILLGSAVLTVFVGFMEEFIFRGLIMRATREVFGRQAAIICSSLLFATLYIGSLSLGYLIFIGLVGVYFAYCVDKTGSLWGVSVAHSLMIIGYIVILPVVAGRPG
jgi:membrane protease YdiL (CAAX protease family)